MHKRVRIIITGRVQGVGFRYSVLQKAQELDLTGWVENMPDGSVEIIAQGLEDTLNTFIDWCRNGPQYAQVENVSIQLQNVGEKLDCFYIRS